MVRIIHEPASEATPFEVAVIPSEGYAPKKFASESALRRTLIKHGAHADGVNNVIVKLRELAELGDESAHVDWFEVSPELLAFLRTPGIAE
jgi:hypothetical protein